MESRPEPPPINPYAPPKATAGDDGNTTYLDQDGYSFGGELIANQHFKSPLICAKLGIPIDPASDPQATFVTVMRTPFLPKAINIIITTFVIVFIWSILIYVNIRNGTWLVITPLVIPTLLKPILSSPYQIPFYLSQQSMRRRKQNSIIFLAITALLCAGLFYSLQVRDSVFTNLSSVAIAIQALIFYYYLKLFNVRKSKGDFHYIRGIHPHLLAAVPRLPDSSTYA